MLPGDPDPHSLRFRIVDTGTLYACSCGKWEDVTDGFEVRESMRLYKAHDTHIHEASQ